MKMTKRTILLFILLALPGFCYSAVHEIAVVTRVRGMVMTSYGREGKQALATRGELLFNQAVIHTGENGLAQVRFVKSGSTVLVTSGSKVLFTLDGTSEAGLVIAGKAIFDAKAEEQGSFDISTPATVTSTSDHSSTLVIHDDNTGSSALFCTDGVSLVPDPGFSEWRPFNAPSAVFVKVGSPFLHTSTLTTGDKTRLGLFAKAAHSMKIIDPLTHTLILQPDSGGRVLPGDTMTALQGYTIEIAAKARPGYVFTRWEVLHGAAHVSNTVAESTTVSVSSDALVAARFTNTPARLIVASKGEGKTDPEGFATIPRYRPWKITAYPYFGYVLDKWVPSDGVEIVATDSVSVTIIVSAADGRITAEFKRHKFTCDISATEGGAVTPGMNTSVVSRVARGISALPDPGYSFIRWEVLKGRAVIAHEYAAVTTISCDSGNAQVRARFWKTNHTSTVTIQPHECADISPCSTIAVPHGETFTLVTRPKNGYELKRWVPRLGNATIVGGEIATVRPQSTSELVPEIITRTFSLTVNAAGPGTTEPAGMTKVFYGTPITIAAEPLEGKKFASWKVLGGDAKIENRLSATTTVLLASTDAVVAAEFAKEVCTLTVDASVGGYVEPADTQVMYEGKQIGLKAVPNPHAAFLGWRLDTIGALVELSDTITAREQVVTLKKCGKVKVYARFSTKTVELTILNNGLGVTSPVKTSWIPQEEWVPLKADPAEGNKFLQWVVVSGKQCEIQDRFSAVTEINPGTENVTVKALFDTSSGYVRPDFVAAAVPGTLQVSVVADRKKGSVEPPGPLILQPGMPQAVTADALPGYTFEEWIVREGNALISDKYSTTADITLTSTNAVVEAVFANEKVHVIHVEFSGPNNQRKTITIPYR